VAVRLTSQFSDGLFQAGLAWLVLLSPERQQTPAAVATAAAVILMPFSLVGPFTGVFLDRWSRRQVLVYGQVIRLALVAALTLAAASEQAGVPQYALAIGCLGVNRFLLAALSAGLPHVVPRDLLVTANAVAPTAGTIATLCGVGTGGVFLSLEGAGSQAVLVSAAVGFAAAGALAMRLSRDALGPDQPPDQPRTGTDLRHVLRDLVAGVDHLRSHGVAARMLTAFGSYRFWYGLWTVQAVMLTIGEQRSDLSGAAIVAAASAAGFVSAALVTPVGRHRVGERPWVILVLLAAASATAVTAVGQGVPALAVTGFVLGLAAQSLKICTDTALQRHLEDGHRGRAFAVYDVTFNVAFVAAAGLAALVVPASGDTTLVPLLGAAGLAVTAARYHRTSAVAAST